MSIPFHFHKFQQQFNNRSFIYSGRTKYAVGFDCDSKFHFFLHFFHMQQFNSTIIVIISIPFFYCHSQPQIVVIVTFAIAKNRIGKAKTSAQKHVHHFCIPFIEDYRCRIQQDYEWSLRRGEMKNARNLTHRSTWHTNTMCFWPFKCKSISDHSKHRLQLHFIHKTYQK